ncbi:MAG: flagellar motor protein MotB, partial [Planctomycetota bacterium]|nr:flagellar motor protein MotB [Planctomycetota bacterium]
MPRKPPHQDEPKQGPPAYMVSFGDMMTLILTFFILLVSMSKERNVDRMAEGIGSFVVALRSNGFDGIMSAEEREEIFEHTRRRFMAPADADKDLHAEASQLELISATVLDSLRPHDEIAQPMVASFAPASDELTAEARAYVDRIAETLRPRGYQVLVLEGHAGDDDHTYAGDSTWLAFARSAAVRTYLIEEHRFDPKRVEARAWIRELDILDKANRSV